MKVQQRTHVELWYTSQAWTLHYPT